MRRLVVLLTLSVGFIAPLAVSVAQAEDAATARASHGTDCRGKRAKKQQSEPKKKDKDKKQYGFEL